MENNQESIIDTVRQLRWTRHKKFLLSEIYKKFNENIIFDYQSIKEYFEENLVNKQQNYLTNSRLVLLSSDHFKLYSKLENDTLPIISSCETCYDSIDNGVSLSSESNIDIFTDEEEQLAIALSLGLASNSNNGCNTVDKNIEVEVEKKVEKKVEVESETKEKYVICNENLLSNYMIIDQNQKTYALIDIDKLDLESAIQYEKYLIVPNIESLKNILNLKDSNHQLNKVYCEFI